MDSVKQMNGKSLVILHLQKEESNNNLLYSFYVSFASEAHVCITSWLYACLFSAMEAEFYKIGKYHATSLPIEMRFEGIPHHS